ncbi:MAG: hypothetical protein F4X64_06990 [Chloroflexi bacterium]|nr:hypothetical protein [Chloroflexota bacterium]
MTTTDAVAHYRKESWRLLSQVDVELERGEIAAASQALWDAAECAIKAAAERRGWAHDSFVALGDVIIRLIDEEGGSIDLNTNFIMASAFDRVVSQQIPLHEAGIRYCSKGPIKNLIHILESMD